MRLLVVVCLAVLMFASLLALPVLNKEVRTTNFSEESGIVEITVYGSVFDVDLVEEKTLLELFITYSSHFNISCVIFFPSYSPRLAPPEKSNENQYSYSDTFPNRKIDLLAKNEYFFPYEEYVCGVVLAFNETFSYKGISHIDLSESLKRRWDMNVTHPINVEKEQVVKFGVSQDYLDRHPELTNFFLVQFTFWRPEFTSLRLSIFYWTPTVFVCILLIFSAILFLLGKASPGNELRLCIGSIFFTAMFILQTENVLPRAHTLLEDFLTFETAFACIFAGIALYKSGKNGDQEGKNEEKQESEKANKMEELKHAEKEEALVEKELEKIKKELTKKALKWMWQSPKTYIALVVIGYIMGFFSQLHDLNERWAWEVAKALITINGIVLGFGILGMTILAKKGFTRTTLRASLKESIDKFTDHLKKFRKGEKETEEYMTKELLSAFIHPIFDTLMVQYALMLSMLYLLASIGLSFCLFGVSDVTMNNPLLKGLFSCVYTGAIITFVLGVYLVLRGIFSLLEKNMGIETGGILKIFIRSLEKKLNALKKEKTKKDEEK